MNVWFLEAIGVTAGSPGITILTSFSYIAAANRGDSISNLFILR